MNDYISVLMIQPKCHVKIDADKELCVFDSDWWAQFNHSISLIEQLKPDIVLYPETFYNPIIDDEYKKLSVHKLIIAGSTYSQNVIEARGGLGNAILAKHFLPGYYNETIVFQHGRRFKMNKNNPSPLEVASASMPYQSFDSLVEDDMWDYEKHVFQVKGRNILILNCMEYYNNAYFMARRDKYNQNLFGIFCPCSSNNITLFEQETIALSNHKENIYSFIANRISPYYKSTTKGRSYIYGPISRTQKQILKNQYPQHPQPEHVCGIVQLTDEPTFFYGEFATITNSLSPFGRSDDFQVTPKNVQIGRLNSH